MKDDIKETVEPDTQTVQFCDGVRFDLYSTTIAEFPELKYKVIQGDSCKFKRFVLPIITKYNITSIDIDTRNELLEFYGELKRYNITLPDQDVYLISRKLRSLTAISHFERKHLESVLTNSSTTIISMCRSSKISIPIPHDY